MRPLAYVLICICLLSCTSREEWIEDFEMTTGVIYKVKSCGGRGSGPGHYSVRYRYQVDGKEYQGYECYGRFGHPKLQSKLKGSKKVIPVAYLKSRPDQSQPMLTEGDFKSLTLNYPDSLKWIEKYLEGY